MRPVVIVKLGSTMPALAARRGDYEDWIAEGLGEGVETITCRVAAGESLPAPAAVRGAVITGSSAFVTDRPEWSERAGVWLLEALEQQTPVLGICYGHQLLAQVLGGELGMNTRGREIGMIEVELTSAGRADELFEGSPSALRFSSSHRQSVLRLPEGAALLASSRSTENQAFRVGERAWGVQFHPEWDADVMRSYLEARRETLAEEGLDPTRLLAAATPSEHGPRILRRFAQLLG